jgi:general secretion pathway protein G
MRSLQAVRARGFTIIELLAVLAMLAALATLAMPLAEVTAQRDRERELKRALWEIRDAIDAYKRAGDAGAIVRAAGTSGYPPSLAALAEGVPDARSGGAQKLYFLRRVPRDPFADESVPAEQTWGLRSYLSEPQSPQPGVDVFDVYSKASGMALNGVPLREW